MSSISPSPLRSSIMYLIELTKSSLLERHLRLGDVLVELAVEAEAADAAEAVALRVEELLVEELLRLVELRRVARAQAAVDLEQRLLVAVGRRPRASVLRISGSSSVRR